jgi:tRNA pseudouridine38-40 synthase
MADSHGVLLQIAYDGTAFLGWATQKEGRTVEDTLRGAIAAFDPRASAPRGTSRTDSGVHADAQMAAFDASRAIPPRGWVLALNQHLPQDVAVRSARPVLAGFNPRFHANGKRYRYRLVLDRVRDPRLRTQAWRVGWPLDLPRLEREAQAIVGEHDFGGFRSAHDPRQATVRTMTRVAVETAPAFSPDRRVVSIVIEGNAFLYNMVRILIGTLVDVARGRLAEGTIARTLASRDRTMAGTTAPAHGLTLEHVDLAIPEGTGAAWPP